jgi:ubiquinol oxidase
MDFVALYGNLDLTIEQQKILQAPRDKYGLIGKALFKTFDIIYGKKRTFSKFKVLEITARIPYQAWENVSYLFVSLGYPNLSKSRQIHDRIVQSRAQQDNEQWHLLMLEEITSKKRLKENFLFFRLGPALLLLAYYPFSWLLYLLVPRWSYGLNADFEDHAMHEYMEFVKEHPEFETEPFESRFKTDYGDPATLADLFRRIGLDERRHKQESLERIEWLRSKK